MKFKLLRVAIAVGLLWVGLPLTAQAGQLYEYKATAIVITVDVTDPASTARLAAVGICTTCTTIITSTFIIDIATPADPDDDMDATTDFYTSPLAGTLTMTTTSGGPITLNDFQRDNVIGVGLNQSDPAIPVDPFDSLGWAGSEPVSETGGPSFVVFNAAAPSAPGAGDGKGYVTLLAGAPPQADLAASTALPTSITLGNWDIPVVVSDWLDTDALLGMEEVQITAGILSFTVTPINAAVPLTSPEGTLLIILSLMGVAVWMMSRQNRAAV